MQEKICSFCGHRTIITKNLEERVYKILSDLIENQGYTTFYSGGMGEFDNLCEKTVRQLKKEHPHIRLCLILYRYNPHLENLKLLFDEIIVPDLENIHYKRQITERNKWMADSSDTVLCYIYKDYGGAHSMMKYAEKENRKIILVN